LFLFCCAGLRSTGCRGYSATAGCGRVVLGRRPVTIEVSQAERRLVSPGEASGPRGRATWRAPFIRCRLCDQAGLDRSCVGGARLCVHARAPDSTTLGGDYFRNAVWVPESGCAGGVISAQPQVAGIFSVLNAMDKELVVLRDTVFAVARAPFQGSGVPVVFFSGPIVPIFPEVVRGPLGGVCYLFFFFFSLLFFFFFFFFFLSFFFFFFFFPLFFLVLLNECVGIGRLVASGALGSVGRRPIGALGNTCRMAAGDYFSLVIVGGGAACPFDTARGQNNQGGFRRIIVSSPVSSRAARRSRSCGRFE